MKYWLVTQMCYFLGDSTSADSRFAPSQWETLLQSNTVSHWLGANLESALYYCCDGDSEGLHELNRPTRYTSKQYHMLKYVLNKIDLLIFCRFDDTHSVSFKCGNIIE